MKNGLLLLLCGMVVATGAALFWRYAGTHGFTVLLWVFVFALILDNRRLRRQLRACERAGARTNQSEAE